MKDTAANELKPYNYDLQKQYNNSDYTVKTYLEDIEPPFRYNVRNHLLFNHFKKYMKSEQYQMITQTIKKYQSKQVNDAYIVNYFECWFYEKYAIKHLWFLAVLEKSANLHNIIRQKLLNLSTKNKNCLIKMHNAFNYIFGTLAVLLIPIMNDKINKEKGYKYS